MFDILESGQNKPFKIKGIAMIKNSLSGNGRFYSDKLVDGVVQKVSKIIEENGSYPITMMADHPGIGTNKTLSTVGRITNMYLEGDNAMIEAEIANTSLGKDVQELISGKFIEGLSIRASKGKFRKRYIQDKLVNDVIEMELQGVDLVTNPGVKGARVTEILESDETVSGLYISILEEEEIIESNPLNPNEEEKIVDLKELKEKYPNLVESLKQEHKDLFESEFKVNDLTESIDTLTSEKATLQESYDALVSEKETLESDLTETKNQLQEAQTQLSEIKESEEAAKRQAHILEKIGSLKFADSVKDAIKGKLDVLESIEKIDEVFEAEKTYLEMVIKESTGIDLSGKGHTGDNNKDKEINEDQEFINLVMGQ